MSLYEMFCADPLHQIEHGVWGKHLWPWFKAYYLLRGELDKLDQRLARFPPLDHCAYIDNRSPRSFKAIPPISKLHHFPNGICRLKYLTAREQGIILRVSRHCGLGLPSGFLNCWISTSPRLDLGFVQRSETRTRSSFQPSDISLVSFSFPGFTPTPPRPYLF